MKSESGHFLLDTHVFLWMMLGKRGIPEKIYTMSAQADSLWLSSISAWEIVVKHRLGKLPLPRPPAELIMEARAMQDIRSLPFTEDHAATLPKLPLLHKDPFDRMLICQAIVNGLTILTSDRMIHRYPVAVYW